MSEQQTPKAPSKSYSLSKPNKKYKLKSGLLISKRELTQKQLLTPKLTMMSLATPLNAKPQPDPSENINTTKQYSSTKRVTINTNNDINQFNLFTNKHSRTHQQQQMTTIGDRLQTDSSLFSTNMNQTKNTLFNTSRISMKTQQGGQPEPSIKKKFPSTQFFTPKVLKGAIFDQKTSTITSERATPKSTRSPKKIIFNDEKKYIPIIGNFDRLRKQTAGVMKKNEKNLQLPGIHSSLMPTSPNVHSTGKLLSPLRKRELELGNFWARTTMTNYNHIKLEDCFKVTYGTRYQKLVENAQKILDEEGKTNENNKSKEQEIHQQQQQVVEEVRSRNSVVEGWQV